MTGRFVSFSPMPLSSSIRQAGPSTTWSGSRVRHYPAVKENTVRMHITAYTANDRNRRHHANARRRRALLFKRSDDRLEPYDEALHGSFDEFGEPGDAPPLLADTEPGTDPGCKRRPVKQRWSSCSRTTWKTF